MPNVSYIFGKKPIGNQGCNENMVPVYGCCGMIKHQQTENERQESGKLGRPGLDTGCKEKKMRRKVNNILIRNWNHKVKGIWLLLIIALT